jgi:hypothetical protein
MKTKREKMTASGNAERYTSHEIVEATQATLGAIHIDPASCREANELVRAVNIFTRADNGLLLPWGSEHHPHHAFVNPPSEGQGDVRRWWLKLQSEVKLGRVGAFVFLCFRIDAVQSMTLGSYVNDLPLPHDFWRCEPMRRIAYRTPGEASTKHAMHSSAIFCHGNADVIYRFRTAFRGIGPILPPRGGQL